MEPSLHKRLYRPLFLKIVSRSEIVTFFRWYLRLFLFILLPCDRLLRVFLETISIISIDVVLDMLPRPMIWSLRPRGYAVCNFLIQDNSQISRDFSNCLWDCPACFTTISRGWTLMKSTSWPCLLECWYTIGLKRLTLRKPRRCSPVRLKSGRPVCPTYCIPQPGLVQVSKYTRLFVF